MKKIRKAVRTFLIKNDEVVVVKYITDVLYGFYDIPGGKIEDGESPIETAIREFKEEAGMEISSPQYAGHLILEYPDRIFDLDVFVTSEYTGEPQATTEHIAEWININKLLECENVLPGIELLKEEYQGSLLELTNFNYHFIVDQNHNIVEAIHHKVK